MENLYTYLDKTKLQQFIKVKIEHQTKVIMSQINFKFIDFKLIGENVICAVNL